MAITLCILETLTLYLNITIFILLNLAIIPSTCSIIRFATRFEAGDQNILYQGDAVPLSGTAELNKVDMIFRVGHVIYSRNVRLWEVGDTPKLSDFTTNFSFTINTQEAANYGHGMAFFLAPVGFEIPPNSGASFLGLFNTTTAYSLRNSNYQIVHVEFDSFPSNEWDPKVEHVGININSLSSAVYTPWNASFHSGDTADVRISYNATNMEFFVHWTYRSTPNAKENTSLLYRVNLMTALPEWVTVGFSASTGDSVERHILRSWEFSSSLDTKEGNKQKTKVKYVVGLTISGLVVLVSGGSLVVYYVRKSKRGKNKEIALINLTSINEDLQRGATGPRRFSYGDLASATNNFSSERKLGEGGFGAVYKGYLKLDSEDDDTTITVAVKRISRGSKQGRKEYVTKVKVISQLRHRNLVQLIGWCHDDGEFLLVYEFMPNGSLDSHLFYHNKNISPLTWDVRHRVSLGLASALLYLHEEWERCVVHRDVKSSNIMLDSNFNAKLRDFGLARLMDHEVGPRTTGLAGTLGYLAPEYVSTGRASKESDVYSFGVVCLEIGSGRKSVDPLEKEYKMGFVEWVWELYGMGELISAVDKRLKSDFDRKQTECLMLVGLWCAQPDPSSRPPIRQVIHVLNLDAPLPNLPTKMPIPSYQVPTQSVKSVGRSITTSFDDQGR